VKEARPGERHEAGQWAAARKRQGTHAQRRDPKAQASAPMRRLSARTIIAVWPPDGPISVETIGMCLLCVVQHRDDGIAISRHEDDSSRTLGDYVACISRVCARETTEIAAARTSILPQDIELSD
jgi:hypothetical protein